MGYMLSSEGEPRAMVPVVEYWRGVGLSWANGDAERNVSLERIV